MTKRAIAAALLAAVTLPAQATAGACAYAGEEVEGKPQTTCQYVEDEARCAAEAARYGDDAWLKAHPWKFVPGRTCNAAVQGTDSTAPQGAPATRKGAAKP